MSKKSNVKRGIFNNIEPVKQVKQGLDLSNVQFKVVKESSLGPDNPDKDEAWLIIKDENGKNWTFKGI